MHNDHVADELRANTVEEGFLLPDYDGYCVANVSATVGSLFDVDVGRPLPSEVFAGVDTGVENVIVLLVDGFGYDCWKRDRRRYELLDSFERSGTITPLTATLPSETTAALTSLHTGQAPAAHGLLGWDQYVEDAGSTIEPLPFTIKGGSEDAGTLVDAGDLFEGTSVYDDFVASGVDSHVFGKPYEVTGPPTDLLLGPAERHPNETPPEIALEVRRTVETADDPTYCYAYFSEVDAAAHVAGTESDLYQNQLAMIVDAVRRELRKLDPDVEDRTLVILTADHGFVDTSPGYVDLYEHEPVAENLASGPDGEPIPPTWWPRLTHLHLQDGTTEDVVSYLDRTLDAYVAPGQEALERGLYGPDVSGTARSRTGDVVVSHRTQLTWYPDGTEWTDYVGFHGGLNEREMLVPFAVAPASGL